MKVSRQSLAVAATAVAATAAAKVLLLLLAGVAFAAAPAPPLPPPSAAPWPRAGEIAFEGTVVTYLAEEERFILLVTRTIRANGIASDVDPARAKTILLGKDTQFRRLEDNARNAAARDLRPETGVIVIGTDRGANALPARLVRIPDAPTAAAAAASSGEGASEGAGVAAPRPAVVPPVPDAPMSLAHTAARLPGPARTAPSEAAGTPPLPVSTPNEGGSGGAAVPAVSYRRAAGAAAVTPVPESATRIAAAPMAAVTPGRKNIPSPVNPPPSPTVEAVVATPLTRYETGLAGSAAKEEGTAQIISPLPLPQNNEATEAAAAAPAARVPPLPAPPIVEMRPAVPVSAAAARAAAVGAAGAAERANLLAMSGWKTLTGREVLPETSGDDAGTAIRMDISEEDWPSLIQCIEPLKGKARYTLTFRARASKVRSLEVLSDIVLEGNSAFVFSSEVTVGTQWKTFRFSLQTRQLRVPHSVYVRFSPGRDPGAVWLADISLTEE